MADACASNHPIVGRRRKHEGPRTGIYARIASASLTAALRGSSDGEADKEATRPRSTPTTPKSGRGLDPFEYDRLIGVNSAESTSGEGLDGEQTDASRQS